MGLWIDEEGVGEAVLFLHGGLGDSRLWAPVAHRLAPHFRCILRPPVLRALDRPADRLGEIAVPTLVVVAEHDPAQLKEIDETVARRVPGARLVRVDSDHYLTLRRPQELGETLLEFLRTAAPAAQ